MTGTGFPHSDTLGSQLGWQLPEDYRGLPRPSSAPDAQTSTVCPQQLDHTQDARIHYATLNTPPHSRPTTPPPPPHTRALDERATSGHHQRTHPPTGVSSGPNSVPKPSSTNGFCVPPSHTHHNHTHTEPAAHGAREIRDKETQPPHRPPTQPATHPHTKKRGQKRDPKASQWKGYPTNTVSSLERR